MTKHSSKSLKGWALATCALTAIMLATSANAQATETHEVKIKAQELGSALMEFGIQTGNEVLFVESGIQGLKTAGLEGNYTTEQAIAALLGKTGVAYRVNDDGTLLVGEAYASVQTPTQSAPAKSGQVHKPVQMAQAQQNDAPVATGASIPEAAGPSGVGDPAEVTGTVTETGSRANLKGAQVLIVETGQTTATDDLGRFRFPSVAPGEYTLAISYLGFTDNSVRIVVESGEDVEQNFNLTGGNDDTNVVYVHGTRSGRAQSLNLQHTAANNSEVVSADLLGNFTGSTISEALQRVPGITFQQSSVTGEGTNIIVRGLAPDLNTVTLNGLRLPDNSGTGRSGDLSNILADSVSKITVNKSLLPSHDSSGTGGLVEIETKSPLDRPKRYFNASIEGGQSGKGFSDDLLVSGTASGIFGTNDQFGLSASAQFRERSFNGIDHRQQFYYGQYLPLEADGVTQISNPIFVDPRRLFPFEAGVGASTIYPWSQDINVRGSERSNLTLGVSAEWQVNPVTNLRLDVQHIDADERISQRSGSEFYFSNYLGLPVVELGGETRGTLQYSNRINTSRGLNDFEQSSKTDIISFRGKSEPGNWTFEYGAGYTKGANVTETKSARFGAFLSHDPAFVAPEAVDPVEGRVLGIFAPVTGGIQQPRFTQAGFDFLNDPALYPLQSAFEFGQITSNKRKVGEVSGRYAFGGETLSYIEAGLYYESAKFDTESNPGKDSYDFLFGFGANAADLGLTIDTDVLGRIGVATDVGILGRANLDEVFERMLTPGIGVFVFPVSVDSRLAGEFTHEEEFSGYVETGLNFGKLEIIGGMRVAQVKTTATKLRTTSLTLANGSQDAAFAEAHSTIVNFDDTVTDVLPRVLANYRQSDDLIFRGGYYFTVARPTISDLSQAPNINLSLFPNGGPSNNQPTLNVGQGNPGLKPAFTHNFDLGAELYNDNVGVIKLGLFYKRIENFIVSNVSSTSAALEGITLPDDPRFQNLPSDIFIRVTRPSNAVDIAEIWGAEAAIEHRFSNLPGLLDGLGIYANYTFSDSNRDASLTWLSSPIYDANGTLIGTERVDYAREAPFAQQSRHSGAAALTYERKNFDASLSYSIQSRRFDSFGERGVQDTFGFDRYTDQADSLDFRAEYRLTPTIGGQYRIWIEDIDLLDGPSDPTVSQSLGGAQGVPEVTASRFFVGGRSFKVGVSATF